MNIGTGIGKTEKGLYNLYRPFCFIMADVTILAKKQQPRAVTLVQIDNTINITKELLEHL